MDPDQKPYIIRTGSRTFIRIFGAIFIILSLLIEYSKTHFVFTSLTIVPFWIPFAITLVGFILCCTLKSSFAVTNEQRMNRSASGGNGILSRAVFIAPLLLIILTAQVSNLQVPSGVGAQAHCDSSAPSGTVLLSENYLDPNTSGPCVATPVIFLAYAADILGLIIIALALHREKQLKGKVRYPTEAEKVHWNSKVNVSRKEIWFYAIAILVFLLVAGFAVSLLVFGPPGA